MEDKGEIFKRKLIELGQKVEELRLEMYPQISDKDEDKTYFDDKMFSLQSELRHNLADFASLLEYKS